MVSLSLYSWPQAALSIHTYVVLNQINKSVLRKWGHVCFNRQKGEGETPCFRLSAVRENPRKIFYDAKQETRRSQSCNHRSNATTPSSTHTTQEEGVKTAPAPAAATATATVEEEPEIAPVRAYPLAIISINQS